MVEDKAPRQARNFAITIIPWDESTKETSKAALEALKPKAKSLIFGIEVAPETGTKHLQGAASFRDKKTFKQVHEMFDPLVATTATKQVAWIKAARNWDALKNYSRKDKNMLLDWDDRYFRETKREISEEAFRLCLQGDPKELVDSFGPERTFKSIRTIREAMAYGPTLLSAETSRSLPYVTWLWGPPGAGKTAFVMRLLKWLESDRGTSTFCMSPAGRAATVWFDGLSKRHGAILIDDLRGENLPEDLFLRMANALPLQVNQKGLMCPFACSLILVTAPVPPWQCWCPRPGHGDVAAQVTRRVNCLIELDAAQAAYPAPTAGWQVPHLGAGSWSWPIAFPGSAAAPSSSASAAPAFAQSALTESDRWAGYRAAMAAPRAGATGRIVWAHGDPVEPWHEDIGPAMVAFARREGMRG